MWALRRVSDPLRKVGCTLEISRACCSKLEMSGSIASQTGILNPPQAVSDRCLPLKRFDYSKGYSSKHFVGRCGLSSQAGSESSQDESNAGDGSSSESELLDEGAAMEDPYLNELQLSDNETDTSDKASGERDHSELIKAILADRRVSTNDVLDKWIAEGKELDRMDITYTLISLRKRHLYRKALQVSEWVDANKVFDLVERDYVSRIDLIAKVHGIYEAEKYIHTVPESVRGEFLYRTLLANYVMVNNVVKAEKVFKTMKDLGYPLSVFACNQMLLLYKRCGSKKIADVLLLMETENLKPTTLTYRMLLDIKGKSNDIHGMEQIMENMKAEGIEPDTRTQTIVARHYILHGMKEKASAILEEMEGGNLEQNRVTCQALLPLYAALGKADEVERVWKVCEPNPWLSECRAAIEAWGKLKRIEEAEAVFQKMQKITKRPLASNYNALLKVYANNNMLEKGKDLVKGMVDNGCRIDPITWDALVRLYVNVGELEKADLMLRRAAAKSAKKPMYSSYMAIMDGYANRGDVHNTERIFHVLKQSAYTIRMRQFQALIRAYKNAKAWPYGIRERMKADNLIPNRSIGMQLAQVDAFRKTAASDLLD